jgi:hypothetical protein
MDKPQVPTWKFWHPLPTWKWLGLIVLGQVVFQPSCAILFTLLGFSGDTGAAVGAGIGGGVAVWLVMRLARQAMASAERDTDKS